jgi:hypothetical protein
MDRGPFSEASFTVKLEEASSTMASLIEAPSTIASSIRASYYLFELILVSSSVIIGP